MLGLAGIVTVFRHGAVRDATRPVSTAVHGRAQPAARHGPHRAVLDPKSADSAVARRPVRLLGLLVALSPGGAAFDVGREVVAGERVRAPCGLVGEFWGVGAGVGPAVAAAGEGEAVEGVDVGLERVQGGPLGGCEVGQDVTRRGVIRAWDQRGIDALGQADDPPSRCRGGDAGGVAVDEDVQDLREEKASVDEEGRRVR